MRTPDEGLLILGTTLRSARASRGLTQQRAAKLGGISRAQLSRLEQGENVSVKFLLKVAKFLGLSEIPLDGRLKLTTNRNGVDFIELIRTLDLLAALIEHVRGVTMHAVLPASEREKLKETPALKEFVTRHATNADGLARLAEAVLQLSPESLPPNPPEVSDETEPVTRRRRTRRGTDMRTG